MPKQNYLLCSLYDICLIRCNIIPSTVPPHNFPLFFSIYQLKISRVKNRKQRASIFVKTSIAFEERHCQGRKIKEKKILSSTTGGCCNTRRRRRLYKSLLARHYCARLKPPAIGYCDTIYRRGATSYKGKTFL